MNQSAYDRANLISRSLCFYVFNFFRIHKGRDYGLDSIDPCPYDDQCNRLGDELEMYWNIELKKPKPNLHRALIKCYGMKFLYQSFKNFILYGILRMAMPLILGRIIWYSTLCAEDREPSGQILFERFLHIKTRHFVVFYCLLLGMVLFLNLILAQPFYMCQLRYGMNIRVAISRLIYEKSLRVTMQSVQRTTVGKIVNLISNDANRFDSGYLFVAYVYMSIIEMMIGMILLYQYIQWSCLGSLSMILVFIPFQMTMAKLLNKFRTKSITLTDNRLRLMSEILPAMRVIKMYVWERPFANLVHIARQLEIEKIRSSMFVRSLNLALYFVSSKIMSFVCFILFLANGGKLDAETVFVTMSLIQLIREVFMFFFPTALSSIVEIHISIKRIQKFLLENEISSYYLEDSRSNVEDKISSKEPTIALNKVNIISENDESSILKNVTFTVVPRKLTVIIGPVGSGKSSILLSILRELPIIRNNESYIRTSGKISYAAQESWIINATVRENILFGQPFNSERYQQVLKMSALIKDLKSFENGDKTMVEDRGTSLSGGQRARISLARALYTDADCYLLDDPLSAVDAEVAKHIFERCIKRYLHDKCVILVTHQLQFIKQADQIVVLKDGTIFACGTYIELLNQGIDVFKYSGQVQGLETPDINQSPRTITPELKTNSNENPFRFRTDTSTSRINAKFNESFESDYDQISMNSQIQEDVQKKNDIETNITRKNNIGIYWIYIRASKSMIIFVLFVITNIIAQIIFTGSDYWLSLWTNYQEVLNDQIDINSTIYIKSSLISANEKTNTLIYTMLMCFLIVFTLVRTFSFFYISMQSSKNLHNQIFSSLMQAPIRFFDQTPIGIIMNRVSRDIAIIDDQLPPTAYDANNILLNSFAIFLMCATLNYYVVIPFIFLLIGIYYTCNFYVETARRLKRLEGMARSPLFQQLNSTLNGLPTIRSYSMETRFKKQFVEYQDQHTATYFTFMSGSRLFGIVLEFFCLIYIYCLMLVMNLDLGSYTGSVIGLTISQSLMLTSTFNFGVRQATELETQMTSVERVVEFGQLDMEDLDRSITKDQLIVNDTNHKMDITFENVSLTYSTNPNEMEHRFALKNLCFHINGGEKIGVVGRTGAGKSSLIVALFRLTQPIGKIMFGNVDTSDISLAHLRSFISIIPQEPVLFSGTIRRNLDPFGERTEDELWDAIEKVQLKCKILTFPAKLDSIINEGGSEFSVGQKQLICLARAILRKNSILILDEATANVDPRTDAMIQQTIRNEFSHCTVITVAHRLHTIIDSDRIMVFDDGRLVQFDKPKELLELTSGIFYQLYSNLGADAREEIQRAVRGGKVNMMKITDFID